MFEPEGTIHIQEPDERRVSMEEVLVDGDTRSIHPVLENKETFGTIKILGVFIMVGIMIVAGRMYDLQIVKGSSYREAAEGNRTRLVQKFAPRGLITDRYGEVIARNTPNFELAVVPRDLPESVELRTTTIQQLSALISVSAADIEALLVDVDMDTSDPISVKTTMTQEEALRLEDFIFRYPAFQIQNRPIREYVDGPIYASILGYVGKITKEEWQDIRNTGYLFNDSIGKTGIEAVYEKALRGKNGGIEYEVDAQGIVTKKLREIESEPGLDLKLTLDAGLQRTLYASLSAMLQSRPGATGAAAVAQNPQTGEVLAMVSLPTYDNNMFARGITGEEYRGLLSNPQKPMLNRVISGTYAPGSTIKSVMGAAALQEGVVTDKTIIRDEGVIRVGAFSFHGWNRNGLGPLNINKAIYMSSDPFFYVVGGGYEPYNISGLGIERIARYYQQFGLGKALGIILPGEASGLVPTPEWKKKRFAGTDEANWYLGNTYHVSIGQGDLLATPLQVNTYTSVFANGGRVMRPVVATGEHSEVISQVSVDVKYMDIIRQALRENVTIGTGTGLRSVPMEVSGKTGTAQFTQDLFRTHAWYTGYAPSSNPQISITVLVEAGGEGGGASLPVVRDTLKWWAENRLGK